MDHGRPAGAPVGSHRREHGGDAGADVLAHDDGDGGAVADLTGFGQSLKDTYRGGAGLDQGGEDRSGQQAQEGVLEGDEKLLEGGDLPQAGHRAGHGLHAEHQRGKPQKDGTRIPPLVILFGHIEDNADKGQHRGEGGGFQQFYPDVAAADARKAEDPGGDGGAHVGPHDDIDGLAQRHKARVDKAHHHHCGGGGALYHRRYQKSGEHSHGPVGGEFSQQGPQLSAGPALQGLAHDIHTEEEKAEAADHGEKVKDIHTSSPFCFCIILPLSFDYIRNGLRATACLRKTKRDPVADILRQSLASYCQAGPQRSVLTTLATGSPLQATPFSGKV